MISAEIVTDVNNTVGLALLVNTPAKVESLLHILKQATRGISPYVNSNKTEYMYFNHDDAIENF